jgi:diketogulonate reductase-like aldo/keto reductase
MQFLLCLFVLIAVVRSSLYAIEETDFLVSATIQLNHHRKMPRIGIGTAGLGGKDAAVVFQALSNGISMIDTAQAREWYSEERVGEGIGDYLFKNENAAKPFIVTKIHPRSFNRGKMYYALSFSRRMLTNQEDDILDVVLLHSPFCWPDHCSLEEETYTWQEGWGNLEAFKAEGKLVANIGVSNFNIEQLKELVEITNTKISVIQNWCDPFHQDVEVRKFAELNGITYMAYSSFGTQWMGSSGNNPVFTNPTLQSIALNHDTTVSEVVLCWLLQEGMVAIPRSSSKQHLLINSLQQRQTDDGKAYKCFLNNSDMNAIRALDKSRGLPW